MIRKLSMFSLLFVLVCLCRNTEAQTIYGPDGLFIHPSAFVGLRDQWGFNLSFFTQTVGANTRTEWLPISLTYGVNGRAEIGALFLDRRFHNHKESGGAFAKYQFFADTPSQPAFAIAGSYLDGDVKQSSIAAVASHDFLQRNQTVFTLDAGVQWARRSDITHPTDGFSEFIGAELPLGRRMRLVGEAGTKFLFDRHSATAIGVKWAASRSVNIGLSFVNTGRSKDNEFFAGVGYAFGGMKGKTP